MTRDEFFEDTHDAYDILNMATDYGYEFDNIYSGEGVEGYINDRLSDKVGYDDWSEVRDWLNNFDDGYSWDDYYLFDGDNEEFTRLDYLSSDNEDAMRDELFEYLVNNGDIEMGDDEDCEDFIAETAPEDDSFEMDFTIEELFVESRTQLHTVPTSEEDDDEAEAMIQMLMYA